MRLDAKQIKQFDEEGWLFLPDCFSDEEVAILRTDAGIWIEQFTTTAPTTEGEVGTAAAPSSAPMVGGMTAAERTAWEKRYGMERTPRPAK